MIQIETIEDFVRVLDDHPEWRDAIRSRLLSQALLDLPEQLAEFAAETRRQFVAIDKQFSEFAAETRRQFAAIDRRFEVIDKQFSEFAAETRRQFAAIDRRFEVIDKQFSEFAAETRRQFVANNERFAGIDKQFARAAAERKSLRDDVGVLKGAHARNVAERRVGLIARSLGLRDPRVLIGIELFDLARDAGAVMQSNEIQSYIEADLVFEAEDEQGGGAHYAAVEVSYTANGRDTTRAVRNAELITQFTGRPCRSVVASVRIDDRVSEEIEAGRVTWYRLPAKTLQAA